MPTNRPREPNNWTCESVTSSRYALRTTPIGLPNRKPRRGNHDTQHLPQDGSFDVWTRHSHRHCLCLWNGRRHLRSRADLNTTASAHGARRDRSSHQNNRQQKPRQRRSTSSTQFSQASRNDPAVDINRLDGVAVDPVLSGIKGDITTQRSKGVVSSGAITVLDTSVTRQEAPKDTDGNPHCW